MPYPGLSERMLVASHVDLSPSTDSPSPRRLAYALLISVVLALAIDAALVHLGKRLFPSTAGYSHFRFSDYGTLTCIGVVLACPTWPVTVRLSSTPRWLFFRLAVLVTIALWIPDVWLIVRHEPTRAVVVLMTMHLAIALVTYNVLVHVAPPRQMQSALVHREDEVGSRHNAIELGRASLALMIGGVGLEFASGVATMLSVSFARPNGWLPINGQVVYLVHGVLGGAVGLGAVALLIVTSAADRLTRTAVMVGLVGMVIAATGGSLAADHRLRSLGMLLMALGAIVSCCGYVVALVEMSPAPTSAPILKDSRDAVVREIESSRARRTEN